eukprot:8211540-Pyramimonas_sp.AAC.1
MAKRDATWYVNTRVPQGCLLSGTLWALGVGPICRRPAQAAATAIRVIAPLSSPPGSREACSEQIVPTPPLELAFGACADDVGAALPDL